MVCEVDLEKHVVCLRRHGRITFQMVKCFPLVFFHLDIDLTIFGATSGSLLGVRRLLLSYGEQMTKTSQVGTFSI